MAQTFTLQALPNQTLSVTLNVNGQSLTLQLTLSWNRMAGFWTISIADQLGNALINSVPLITGDYPAANILAPFQWLQIGSAFVVNTSYQDPLQSSPTDTNLGSSFALLWDDNVGYLAQAA